MSCADDLLYASPLPGCLERSVFVALTCIFAVIYGLYTLACAKAAHVRYAEKTTNLQHVAIYGMSAMSSAFALTSVVLNATSASPAVKMFFFKISIIALLSLLIKALYFITRLLVASVVSRRSRKSRRKSRKQGGDASGGSKEMQSIMTLSWRDPFTALLLFSVYGSGIGLSFAGAVLGLASHEDLGVVVFSSGISAFALVFATLVYVQVTKMQRYVEHTIAGVKSPASAVAVGAPRSSNLVSSPGGSSLGTSDPKRGKPKHGFEDFLKRLGFVRVVCVVLGCFSASVWAAHASLVLPLYWYMTFVHYLNMVALTSVLLFFFTRKSFLHRLCECLSVGGVGAKSDASSVRPATAEVATATHTQTQTQTVTETQT